MPDNVTIDPGTTPSVPVTTDLAGDGSHVQVVKLALSADGSSTRATVDADGVLVNLGTNNDVTVTGSVTANAGTNLNTSTLALEAGGNLAGAATSLAILDDWDETDRAKVNLIVGQAGIAAGAGNVAATVPRVTLAADDPAVVDLAALEVLSTAANAILTTIDADTGGILTAVQTLDNAISGSEMQVDVVAALPAGDNNIGNVDIVTVPRATTVVDVSLGSDTTSAQLLAANANRIGLTLTNTDANAVYVYFGTTAVATKFTVKIPADGYYEMPQPIYTGRIDALWAGNGSGSLIGTELAA
jgi:hypothetical protein